MSHSNFLLHPAMERTGNRVYNLQDPRKPKAECRTCKQPFVGTPMQKDCDECRRRKAR